ncbi:hypothetical protein BO94DRAFT_577147 [Aspergillus sclerotioniger CBS 115572]|uniref:Uncharacterized protein n=1 Tax=Aspergillus sclerotioniger CBS 115572 TaxID=1450535 RepID=A0A317W2H5_9EURO|nr:hypothetical protein BO94DRAFT_577147 [Aspergillus sclerotioniger CBS 115572]PWY79472.1 hypothetical protein BO94DRAFT_577147 [Aspergillus sclerotioniger CBS 115572]
MSSLAALLQLFRQSSGLVGGPARTCGRSPVHGGSRGAGRGHPLHRDRAFVLPAADGSGRLLAAGMSRPPSCSPWLLIILNNPPGGSSNTTDPPAHLLDPFWLLIPSPTRRGLRSEHPD